SFDGRVAVRLAFGVRARSGANRFMTSERRIQRWTMTLEWEDHPRGVLRYGDVWLHTCCAPPRLSFRLSQHSRADPESKPKSRFQRLRRRSEICAYSFQP